jgi:large subunit ribosomal protein L15
MYYLMPSRLRRVRKLRGSRHHGWGQVSQHRESGSRGGRGAAGKHKHHWSHTVKYEPNYFGKDGFKSLQPDASIVNVGELVDIISKYQLNEASQKAEDILDLTQLGFDKLLGRGNISTPVKVKVKEYSESALKKIEEAGGQILKLE